MNNKNNKYAWLNTTLTTIVSIFIMYIVFNINKYSKLSKGLFLIINAVALATILILVLSTIKINHNNKKRKLKIAYTSILSLLLIFTSYGIYVLNVVDTNVKEITTEDKFINYKADFVVYESEIGEVSDLNNKTLGLIESTNIVEANVLALDEIKKLKLEDVEIVYYPTYTSLINGLVRDEVDFIPLPRNYKSSFDSVEEVKMYLDDLESVHLFSGKYKNNFVFGGNDIEVTKTPFTVLLLGYDGGRTDTIMLASVNPAAMQVTLTSIARDSFVPIACYPNQASDKINHARMISRQCTINTVENMVGIPIDFFVEMNFMGMVELVDALGTVTVDSPASFYGNIETEEGGGVFIPEGISDLDGNQALAFARERKSFLNGDFQRQQNQQQLIKSILNKVVETRDVNKVVNLIKATGRNVETNISLNQLIDLMDMGIKKMESTYLNSSEIFTLYGSRITGASQMWYTPEYGIEIYYYVPYEGSIQDAQEFINMNLRKDKITDIPLGFNYKISEDYKPPVFDQEIYDEDVNKNPYEGLEPPKEVEEDNLEEVPEINPEGENEEVNEDDQTEGESEVVVEKVSLRSYSNERLDNLVAFLESNNLKYEIVSIAEKVVKADEENLIGLSFVVDNSVGEFTSKDLIEISIVKYVSDNSEKADN